MDGPSSDHILLAQPYICSEEGFSIIVTTLGKVQHAIFSWSDSSKGSQGVMCKSYE